jgi:hypothetical protein
MAISLAELEERLQLRYTTGPGHPLIDQLVPQ